MIHLFVPAWYGALAVTAMFTALISQNFTPALLLITMLSVLYLHRGRTGVLIVVAGGACVAAIGFMLAAQPSLSPLLRSEALNLMVLAPVFTIAVVSPAILCMDHGKQPVMMFNPENQSSMSSMSDSTSRDTVGKVTPVANRSRAA